MNCHLNGAGVGMVHKHYVYLLSIGLDRKICCFYRVTYLTPHIHVMSKMEFTSPKAEDLAGTK